MNKVNLILALICMSCNANELQKYNEFNTGAIIGKIGINSIINYGSDYNISKLGLINLLKIDEDNTIIAQEVITDSSGYFKIINLEEGIYHLNIRFINPDSSLTIPLNPGSGIHGFGSSENLISKGLCNKIQVKDDSISVIRFQIRVFTKGYLDMDEMLESGSVYGYCDYLDNYFLCDYLPSTEPILMNYRQYCGFTVQELQNSDITFLTDDHNSSFGAVGIRIDTLGIFYQYINSLEEIQCLDW